MKHAKRTRDQGIAGKSENQTRNRTTAREKKAVVRVRFPSTVIPLIDAAAAAAGEGRSGFIADAVQRKMQAASGTKAAAGRHEQFEVEARFHQLCQDAQKGIALVRATGKWPVVNYRWDCLQATVNELIGVGKLMAAGGDPAVAKTAEEVCQRTLAAMHPGLIKMEQAIYNATELLDLMACRQAAYAKDAGGFDEDAVAFGSTNLASDAGKALLDTFQKVFEAWRERRRAPAGEAAAGGAR